MPKGNNGSHRNGKEHKGGSRCCKSNARVQRKKRDREQRRAMLGENRNSRSQRLAYR